MDPDEGPADDGKVLSPQELDLEDKDGVEEIEDGRYVVSADGTEPELPTKLTEDARDTEPTVDEQEPDDERAEPIELDRDAVRGWCTDQLEDTPCEYGYHVSMKAGDSIEHHALHSDDVTMAFNNLLVWYAQTVDRDLPPGAVLGILLSDASVSVRYPTKAFEEFLLAHGFSTDDTIGDLLATIRDDDEVVFPPRRS